MAAEIEPDDKLDRHQDRTPFLSDTDYVFRTDSIRVEDGDMQLYNSCHPYDYYDVKEDIYKKNIHCHIACLPSGGMDRA